MEDKYTFKGLNGRGLQFMENLPVLKIVSFPPPQACECRARTYSEQPVLGRTWVVRNEEQWRSQQ